MCNKFPIVASIIIPCYNSEKTIEETLNSLEVQVYKNFEVIIVNDGSTDNTESIIKNWINTYSIEAQYHAITNSGVSAARNKGLSNVRGKYVLFLDSDDIYHPNYLNELIYTMESYDVDTVFCSYSTDLNNLIGNSPRKRNPKLLNYKTLMDYYLYNKIPCALWTFIYKREIIEERNLLFTVGAKYGEDGEFLWKYLAHCKKGVALNVQLYGYFINENSATRTVSFERTESLNAIKRVDEYLEKINSAYLNKFRRYAYNRTLLSILKTFAEVGASDLYISMLNHTKIKKKISSLIFFPDFRIILSALAFKLNTRLFYKIMLVMGQRR